MIRFAAARMLPAACRGRSARERCRLRRAGPARPQRSRRFGRPRDVPSLGWDLPGSCRPQLPDGRATRKPYLDAPRRCNDVFNHYPRTDEEPSDPSAFARSRRRCRAAFFDEGADKAATSSSFGAAIAALSAVMPRLQESAGAGLCSPPPGQVYRPAATSRSRLIGTALYAFFDAAGRASTAEQLCEARRLRHRHRGAQRLAVVALSPLTVFRSPRPVPVPGAAATSPSSRR